jgi:hypothetical protein
MKTSKFLQTLRAHRALPVVLRRGGDSVPAGWHMTEAKRVSYETMDCGAMTHRWDETQFEIWVPPFNGINPARGHMAADKFLKIVDRVERELTLKGDAEARIHAVLGDGPPALWDIESAAPSGGQLVVSLSSDRTRCKAAERRACNLASGVCGDQAKDDDSPCCSGESTPGAEKETACCGTSIAQAEKAVCCT